MIVSIRDTTDRAAAMHRLRAVEPHAVGACSVERMAYGAHLLDVIEDGRVIGAAAVEIRGTVATITACQANGEGSEEEIALLETALSGKGVRRVCLTTKRPGLVRKMLARGYVITECNMEKGLNHHGR